MTKRAAVIDLGTYTWNLAIAEQKEDQLRWIFSDKAMVKLAENALDDQLIKEAAKERAFAAIRQHISSIESHSIPLSNVVGFGTSGMRSFTNGSSLAQEIRDEFGIQINIIDGDEEASLIKKGIAQAIRLPKDEPYLLMDIGGGSTEFILGIGHKTLWQTSTKLGVSRLKETYQPNDPMAPIDVDMLTFHFDTALAELREQLSIYPVNCLIGSSGSYESLATIQLERSKSDEELNNNFELSLNDANNVLQKLIISSYEDRLDWPGLPTMRAETMQIAALLIQFVMGMVSPNQLHISFYALKEGAMLSWMNQIRE
jgi:exopolyphosphatase/guanosine-5'-triphosphate,3'-diphosphate pyrophosphatase